MKFTKAIYFKDGKSLTITEQEVLAAKERLLDGDRWIEVQGNFISADNVARIGQHESTTEIKKWNETNLDRSLIAGGRQDLVDAKRKLIKEKTLNAYRSENEMLKKLIAGDPEAIRYYNSQSDEPKRLEIGTEESGDFYKNEDGIKHHN